MKEEAAYLRRYFELPFGIHWYHWNDMKSKAISLNGLGLPVTAVWGLMVSHGH